MNATSNPPPEPDTDAAAAGPAPRVVQESLPLDPAVADEPIPFALTARARRVIAPESLPDLAVVSTGAPAGVVGAVDTRVARARALRRSGRSVAAIARALSAEPAQVSRWTGDVDADVSSRRRGRPATTHRARAATGSAASSDDSAPTDQPERDAAAAAFAQRAAAGDVRALVAAGVVATSCEVQRHAVVVGVRDLDTAVAVLSALAATVGVDPGRLRVTVVAGAAVARDLERARWSRALEVPSDHVTVAPWPDAPRSDAVRATLRIPDRDLAAAVEGWRRAALVALEPSSDTPTWA